MHEIELFESIQEAERELNDALGVFENPDSLEWQKLKAYTTIAVANLTILKFDPSHSVYSDAKYWENQCLQSLELANLVSNARGKAKSMADKAAKAVYQSVYTAVMTEEFSSVPDPIRETFSVRMENMDWDFIIEP